MNKFTSTLKLKKVYVPLIIIAIIVVGISTYKATHKIEYDTATVTRSDFEREVSVTGKVVAAEDVGLAFETSGKIDSSKATIGAKVSKGQILASLSADDTYASVLQAQARLDAENAKLAELIKGTRSEELAVSQTAYDQAKQNLTSAIADAYTKSDNSIKTNVDNLYFEPTSKFPEIVDFGNKQQESDLQDERVKIQGILDEWQVSAQKLQSGTYSERYLSEARDNLNQVSDFLNNLAFAFSSFSPNTTHSQAEIDSYRGGISSARSTVSAAIANLNSSEQAFRGAEANLNLAAAGSTSEEIQAEQANVKSAQASLLQQQALYSKNVLTAPFNGTITKNDLKVGEIAIANTPVITLISNANFEIESYIPEADIAKVKVGDTAKVTLDAYGDDQVFDVVVTQIDLSDTQVAGVSTYKTVLQFDTADDRIKSGMTANIDIQNEARKDVLNVPQLAITNTAGKKTVLVMDENGKTTEREVKTGSIDTKGNIEITDGLSEGEKVAWPKSK